MALSAYHTVAALADLIGGRIVGDPNRRIRDVADLRQATPEHISFLANPKYFQQFQTTRAGAVLVHEGVEGSATTLICCQDPYVGIARIASFFHPPPRYSAGIEPGAHIHPSATIDPTATIRAGAIIEANATVGARSVLGPHCYLGVGAQIGADCVINPSVQILERCIVGNQVILHSGVVIGSDGFGYAPDPTGKRHKIPQVGIVVIEDDVEIGANTTVDRATFGETRIGRGCKIDNLVQIAHNVVLGDNCVVVSQSGIAGSTTLGQRVILGAQTGVVGHIQLGDDVILAARGAASHDLQAGVYAGAPAIPHKKWLKAATIANNLADLRDRVRRLEALTSKSDTTSRE